MSTMFYDVIKMTIGQVWVKKMPVFFAIMTHCHAEKHKQMPRSHEQVSNKYD